VEANNGKSCAFCFSMSEEDVEINIEVDDGITVVIGPDKETAKPKRKRGKDKEPSPAPEANGSLSLTVHIISSTAAGDQLTKSRKSITIVIADAGCYIENIDLEDPRNNTERPYISASNAHGLVINHLGQKAADTLLKVASGNDPHLFQRLKINSNPDHLVRA
jgi:hypothetical protein